MSRTCKTCGKPVRVKRAQCYTCKPAITPKGKRSSKDRFLWQTITRKPGIKIKHPAPVAAEVEGCWQVAEGNDQVIALRQRKATDRKQLGMGKSTDRDDEREAWASLARAERARTSEEHSCGKGRRRPGDGITGTFAWDGGSLAGSLFASQDAGQPHRED